MIAEYPVELRLILCTLVVWRLTHLIVAEDGPWDLVFKLRVLLGNSEPGRAMDCFYCTSVWIAMPGAFVAADAWPARVISWLALSGAASLLEQATNRSLPQGHKPTPHLGKE